MAMIDELASRLRDIRALESERDRARRHGFDDLVTLYEAGIAALRAEGTFDVIDREGVPIWEDVPRAEAERIAADINDRPKHVERGPYTVREHSAEVTR